MAKRTTYNTVNGPGGHLWQAYMQSRVARPFRTGRYRLEMISDNALRERVWPRETSMYGPMDHPQQEKFPYMAGGTDFGGTIGGMTEHFML